MPQYSRKNFTRSKSKFVFGALSLIVIALLLCSLTPRGLSSVAFAATGTGRTYTTKFPVSENPISEGGNWINGGAVGLNWHNARTTSGLVFSAEPLSDITHYDDATIVVAGSWGPDQTVQATVHTVNQKDYLFEELELRLRTTITAHSITGYEILFHCTNDSSSYADIVRWNGPFGSWGSILGGGCPGHSGCMVGSNRASYGIANGDVIKATIVGSTIKAYKNGVLVMQGTDSTFSGGNPGLGFNWFANAQPLGNTQTSDFGFTEFLATDGSQPQAPAAPANLSAIVR